MRTQVLIIGGGPAGLLLSQLLHRRGTGVVCFAADLYGDGKVSGAGLFTGAAGRTELPRNRLV